MTCSSLAFVAPSVSLLPSLVATRRRSGSILFQLLLLAALTVQCLHSTKLFQNKPSSLQEENDEEEEDDYFLQQELARIESLDSNSNIPTNDKDDDDDDWTAAAFHDFR